MNRQQRRKEEKNKGKNLGDRVVNIEKAIQQIYVEVLTLRKHYIDLSEAILTKGVLTKEEMKAASEAVSKATAEVNDFVKKVNDTLNNQPGGDGEMTLRQVAKKSLEFGVHPSRYSFAAESQQNYLLLLIDEIKNLDIEESAREALAKSQGLDQIYRQIKEQELSKEVVVSNKVENTATEVVKSEVEGDVDAEAEQTES